MKTRHHAARQARETGLFGTWATTATSPGDIDHQTWPIVLEVSGPDAANFLHNQLTNEVKALKAGEGNLTARVKRTGHLIQILLLCRLPEDVNDHPAFIILTEGGNANDLIEAFDAYLFSEDISFNDRTGDFGWAVIQGPRTIDVVGTVLGEDQLSSGITVRHMEGDQAPPGTLVFSHSVLSDPGCLIAVDRADEPACRLFIDGLEHSAQAAELTLLDHNELKAAFDVLRIEAGFVRMADDVADRERLLPETCFENQLVSYTKGCYLGQEVIARVRTYGSLPFELRGLVLENESTTAAGDDLDVVLEQLPAAGDKLALADGTVVGQIVSRTVSPAMGSPVAMAFLKRSHRVPGTKLMLAGKNRPIAASVALLPFYRASEHSTEAEAMYAQAISVFATGQEEQALRLLEKALSIDPTSEECYEAVGLILGRAGRFEEAISIFRRLEELAPSEAMVNTNLSLYYMKIGDKATAEEHAACAMRKAAVGVGSGLSATESSEIEAQGARQRKLDAERKREMFSKVIDIDPEDPVALFGLGNSLAELDEWEQAEQLYARAIEAQKSNSAIYLAHGKALEKLARIDDAVAIYKKGMDVASRRGDLAPLREMQTRALLLEGSG